MNSNQSDQIKPKIEPFYAFLAFSCFNFDLDMHFVHVQGCFE